MNNMANIERLHAIELKAAEARGFVEGKIAGQQEEFHRRMGSEFKFLMMGMFGGTIVGVFIFAFVIGCH